MLDVGYQVDLQMMQGDRFGFKIMGGRFAVGCSGSKHVSFFIR